MEGHPLQTQDGRATELTRDKQSSRDKIKRCQFLHCVVVYMDDEAGQVIHIPGRA